MSCLCAGRTSKKEYPPIIELGGLSYSIQIGNGKKKWKSSELAENDPVSLVDDDNNPQFWQLQRAEDYSLWTFHVKPEGGKELYMTYNGGDQKDQKVRMHSAPGYDSSKEKYFEACMTSSGKIVLSSLSSKERFLGIKDGILAMIDEEWWESNIEWILGVDLTSSTGEFTCEIKDYNKPSQGWISSDAKALNNIELASSREKQLWKISQPSSGKCTMETKSEPGNFAGQSGDCKDEILFYKTVTDNNSSLIKYYQKSERGALHKFRLQNTSNNWFVGTQSAGNRKTLQMKEREKQAPFWKFVVNNFPLEEDGSPVPFPPHPKK